MPPKGATTRGVLESPTGRDVKDGRESLRRAPHLQEGSYCFRHTVGIGIEEYLCCLDGRGGGGKRGTQTRDSRRISKIQKHVSTEENPPSQILSQGDQICISCSCLFINVEPPPQEGSAKELSHQHFPLRTKRRYQRCVKERGCVQTTLNWTIIIRLAEDAVSLESVVITCLKQFRPDLAE